MYISNKILDILLKEYPDAKYYLNFSSPLELLEAAILSAQIREEVVNATTSWISRNMKMVTIAPKLSWKN